MRPVVVYVAGSDGGPHFDGAGQPVPIDYMSSPFSLSISVTVHGIARYSVEHTHDDVFALSFDPRRATWHYAPSPALVNSTQTGFGGYSRPVTAVRVRVHEGAGMVVMTVMLGGAVPQGQPQHVVPYQDVPTVVVPTLPPEAAPGVPDDTPLIADVLLPVPSRWERLRTFIKGLFK